MDTNLLSEIATLLLGFGLAFYAICWLESYLSSRRMRRTLIRFYFRASCEDHESSFKRAFYTEAMRDAIVSMWKTDHGACNTRCEYWEA